MQEIQKHSDNNKLLTANSLNPTTKELTRSDWELLLKEWEESGLTQKQFCASKRLTLSTFAYYRTQQRRQEKIAVKPRLASIQLKDRDLIQRTGELRLRFKRGEELVIPANMDAPTLRQLLITLGML